MALVRVTRALQGANAAGNLANWQQNLCGDGAAGAGQQGGGRQVVGGQGGKKFTATQMAPKRPQEVLDQSLSTVVCGEGGRKEIGTSPEPVGSLV